MNLQLPPEAEIVAIEAPPIKTVLVMRTCDASLRSWGRFQWPASGMVSAPDWSPDPVCGQGLHGLLWGEGDGGLLDWSEGAKWLVCRVDESTIVNLGRKVKFPSCEVIFCGDRKTAPDYISANGAAGRAVVSGTATAGRQRNGHGWQDSGTHVKDEDGDGELEPNVKYQLDEAGQFVRVEILT